MSFALTDNYLPADARRSIAQCLGVRDLSAIKCVSKTFAGRTVAPRRPAKGPLKAEEVRARLIHTICKVMQEICADNEERMLSYTKKTDALSGGIFYPRDYFVALKARKQKERLAYFLQHDSFYNGYLSPKYFRIEENPQTASGKRPCAFILKEKADAVEALQSIRKGLSLIGCGEVCQVAHYEAILDIIGPEKFRVLFAGDSSTSLKLGLASNNPIGRLRTYFMKESPKPLQLKKGDQVYIAGFPRYFEKHVIGACSGYNTICYHGSGKTFMALGLSSKGETLTQVNESLIRGYNIPISYFEYLSQKTKQTLVRQLGAQKLSISEKNKEAQISMTEYQAAGGGKVTLICQLDYEKVTKLANATLDEARVLLNGFKAERLDCTLRK